MKVSEVLEKALALMGPNGEHWVNRCPPSTHEYCTITAVWQIEHKQPVKVCRVIRKAIGIDEFETLSAWNDSSKWPDIQAGFQKAIALARQEESLDAK